MILGVGAGHVEGEFAALGIPFAERGRITDAAVDGILEAWTDEYVGDVGLRPASGGAAPAADLDRRLVEARAAARRGARRRLDPAGDAEEGDAGGDRLHRGGARPRAARRRRSTSA